MDKDDDYRREAADARELANQAKNADDRAAWLRIAQSWIDLLRKPLAGEQQSAPSRSRQGRQDGPDSPH